MTGFMKMASLIYAKSPIITNFDFKTPKGHLQAMQKKNKGEQ